MLTLWFAYIMMTLAANFHRAAPVPTYPAPVIPPAMLEQVKEFTVLISNEGIGGVSRGTGVLIDSTHVLTCAHMLESDSQPWIYTYPVHNVVLAKGAPYVDRQHDVAILELSQPIKLKHYATFASSPTVIGQPIVVVGNTMGLMMWFTSYGIISEKEFFYDLTTATIHGGNSGGPWVDLSGNIVDLTDWGLENSKRQEEGISGGINAEILKHDVDEFHHPQNLLMMLMGG
jgi:S1-C subfamily serine protease